MLIKKIAEAVRLQHSFFGILLRNAARPFGTFILTISLVSQIAFGLSAEARSLSEYGSSEAMSEENSNGDTPHRNDPPPQDLKQSRLTQAEFNELASTSSHDFNRPDIQQNFQKLNIENPTLYEQILGSKRMKALQEHHAAQNTFKYFAVNMPLNTINFYFGVSVFNMLQCMGSGKKSFVDRWTGLELIGTNGIFARGDPAPCRAFYESLKDWRTWVGFTIFVETSRIVGGLTGKLAQHLIVAGEAAMVQQYGRGILLRRIFGSGARSAGMLVSVLGGSYLGLIAGSLANDTWSEITAHPEFARFYTEIKKGNYITAGRHLDSVYRQTMGDPMWLHGKKVDLMGLVGGAFLAKMVRPVIRGALSAVEIVGGGGIYTAGTAMRKGYVSWMGRGVQWVGSAISKGMSKLRGVIQFTEAAGEYGRIAPSAKMISGVQRFVIHGGVDLVIFFLAIDAFTKNVIDPYVRKPEEAEKLDQLVRRLNERKSTFRQRKQNRLWIPTADKTITETERGFDDFRNYVFVRAEETYGAYQPEFQKLEIESKRFFNYYLWITLGAKRSPSPLVISIPGQGKAKKDRSYAMWETNIDSETGEPWHCENEDCEAEVKTHLWNYFCAKNPWEMINGEKELKTDAVVVEGKTIKNIPLPNFRDLLFFWPKFVEKYDGQTRFKEFGVALNRAGVCDDELGSIKVASHEKRLARANAKDFGFDSEDIFKVTVRADLNPAEKAKRINKIRTEYQRPEKLGAVFGARVDRVLKAAIQAPRFKMLAVYRRLMQKRTFKAIYGKDAVMTPDGSYEPKAGAEVETYRAPESGHTYEISVLGSYDQEIKLYNDSFLQVEGFEKRSEIPMDFRPSPVGARFRLAADRAVRKKEAALKFVRWLTASSDEARTKIRLEDVNLTETQQIESNIQYMLKDIPADRLEYIDGIIIRSWEEKMFTDK